MTDVSPMFPEGAGQLINAILAPPTPDGPPYTHDATPRPCAECVRAGDPECRDGLLYRDGGEALDYADVYVGRCSHLCHQPQPAYTIVEER
ncbi:hypothetical protein OG824_31830 [Streptomyces prunicolor]|uniref:hypothetical protein n=1 Tax=Streptomyces prunicolor TaxID=67348 RepID=UPI002250D85D|nr:hypothetical protein [Streptomyces prunicolor]MCX5239801.1 hypothetical protein [Streptomyces prunicolor]